MMIGTTALRKIMVIGGVCAVLMACSSLPEGEAKYPEWEGDKGQYGKVTGEDGIQLFGPDKDAKKGTTGIGVNGFLWRASLDTVSFMPLTSADPFGGVIITDWYAPAEAPDERVKVTVYILSQELRSDGLRVAVFRQRRQGGGWVDASVEKQTATNLENAILTRARELKVQGTTGEQ